MAYIKKLKDSGSTFYPVTITPGIIDTETGSTIDLHAGKQDNIRLTRLGCILTSTAASNSEAVYFPSVIRNRTINASGSDYQKAKYWLFYSSDHATNAEGSGISMAYSDSIAGPWTRYGTGKIVTLANQVSGQTATDCETPSVWWSARDQKYFMTWHTASYNSASPYNYAQTTYISESVDGVTWSFVKRMFDIPLREIAGNGHNGYTQVYQIDNEYYATTLLGGGSGYMTDAYSPDGLHWMINPWQDNAVNSQFKLNGTISPGSDVLVEFNQSALFKIGGQWYKIGGGGIPSSGTAAKKYDIYCMPVLTDKRTPGGIGKIMLAMDTTLDETKNIRNTGAFTDDDGQVYIFYTTRVGTGGTSKIHAAKVEVI